MSPEAQFTLFTTAAGVFAALVTAGNYLIRLRFSSERAALRVQNKTLEQANKQLEAKLKESQGKGPPPDSFSPAALRKIEELQAACGDLEKSALTRKQAIDKLQVERDELLSERDGLAKELADVRSQLAAANASFGEVSAVHAQRAEEHTKEGKSRQNVIRKTLKLEGKIWLQKVLSNAPKFRSLDERKAPIISLLNLKGGVGKTTLTAGVGMALVRKGYRVLLVDLDLQGSLSSLFLSDGELAQRSKDGKVLRHLLAACAQPRAEEDAGGKTLFGAPRPGAHLDDYAYPASRLGGQAHLLATTDKLAYEELSLTFQWLLRIGKEGGQWSGKHDVRLLLRQALHSLKGLKKRYDVVLMDCPPIVNLCCVNALAASDYVIIPVTPSRKALERVPPTLRRLREMKEKVNPSLNVLGLVVNRTQQAAVSDTEQTLLNTLPKTCHSVWGTPLHVFPTTLPQRAQVRDAEDDFPPKEEDGDLVPRLVRLAGDIEQSLPPFCGPSRPAWSPARAAPAPEVPS